MRKHIICNHDDNKFWFEYRTGSKAVINDQSEFETLDEFEECYNKHTGPLFPLDNYLAVIPSDNCFSNFNDVVETESVDAEKELQRRSGRINIQKIAEHHHQYGPGMQALVNGPKSYAELQKETAEDYQGLFDFFAVSHQLILTVGQMDDVVHAVKEHEEIPDVEIGVMKRGGWVPFLRVENQTFYIQYESSDKKEVEWMADNLRTAINKLL